MPTPTTVVPQDKLRRLCALVGLSLAEDPRSFVAELPGALRDVAPEFVPPEGADDDQWNEWVLSAADAAGITDDDGEWGDV